MSGNLYIAAFYMAGGVALFLLGLVILRENPRQRINRVTGTMMFLYMAGPLVVSFRSPTFRLRGLARVGIDGHQVAAVEVLTRPCRARQRAPPRSTLGTGFER